MTEPFTMTCPGCGQKRPTFLTKVCGRCIYRQALATKQAAIAKERAREASQDRSGTVGDPGAEAKALADFDTFSRAVRAAAGC